MYWSNTTQALSIFPSQTIRCSKFIQTRCRLAGTHVITSVITSQNGVPGLINTFQEILRPSDWCVMGTLYLWKHGVMDNLQSLWIQLLLCGATRIFVFCIVCTDRSIFVLYCMLYYSCCISSGIFVCSSAIGVLCCSRYRCIVLLRTFVLYNAKYFCVLLPKVFLCYAPMINWNVHE